MEDVLMSKLPAGESRLPDLYESDLDFQTLERELAIISSSLAQQQKTMDVDGIISTLNDHHCNGGKKLFCTEEGQNLHAYVNDAKTHHCMLAHVHKAQTDSLDMKEIAKDFMQRNDVRASFFGSFE
ncbi:hypothetical protein ACOMHN_018999 [Nucella lapillus]